MTRRKPLSLPDTRYERSLMDQGYAVIAGADEVGRGPLAGPVVAAAVILEMGNIPEGLDDSKRLTAKRRTELAHEIMHRCVDYQIAWRDSRTIDAINILEATKEAMSEAIACLAATPDALLLDAIHLPRLEPIHQVELIKGDQRSVSIAAASILAKVIRDGLMQSYELRYPGYGFGQHKGYGTRQHVAGLDALGPCPIHRRSFLRKWEARRG